MPEKILSITEVFGDHESGYDGYEVQTDKQKVSILVSNEQNCCESWGTLSTPDDVQQFVGANLLGISRVKNRSVDEYDSYDSDLFINIETSIGQLQLGVYNHHNGYYGHSVKIVSDDPDVSYDGYI